MTTITPLSTDQNASVASFFSAKKGKELIHVIYLIGVYILTTVVHIARTYPKYVATVAAGGALGIALAKWQQPGKVHPSAQPVPNQEQPLAQPVAQPSATFERDKIEFDRLYDRYVQSPLGENFSAFKAYFENLYQKNRAYIESPANDNQTAIQTLRGMHANFRRLQLGSSGIDWSRELSLNKEGVLDVAKDGNCLYECVRAALRLADKPIPEISQMRKDVSEWLQLHINYPPIQAALFGVLLEHKEKLRQEFEAALAEKKSMISMAQAENDVQWEQQIQASLHEAPKQLRQIEQLREADYIEAIKENGFFANSAEIAAVSELYQMQIQVYNKGMHDHPMDVYGRQFPTVIKVSLDRVGKHYRLGPFDDSHRPNEDEKKMQA